MSLKVINILSIDEFLTVDNTIVSVDQTNISADQLEMTPVDSILKVPYRFFNSEVKLVLWNEIKETKSTLLLTAVENSGEMVLTFTHNFKDGETYEVLITDLSDKLIWRGNILATIQTDLDNYILHKVADNNIIKI